MLHSTFSQIPESVIVSVFFWMGLVSGGFFLEGLEGMEAKRT